MRRCCNVNHGRESSSKPDRSQGISSSKPHPPPVLVKTLPALILSPRRRIRVTALIRLRLLLLLGHVVHWHLHGHLRKPTPRTHSHGEHLRVLAHHLHHALLPLAVDLLLTLLDPLATLALTLFYFVDLASVQRYRSVGVLEKTAGIICDGERTSAHSSPSIRRKHP